MDMTDMVVTGNIFDGELAGSQPLLLGYRAGTRSYLLPQLHYMSIGFRLEIAQFHIGR